MFILKNDNLSHQFASFKPPTDGDMRMMSSIGVFLSNHKRTWRQIFAAWPPNISPFNTAPIRATALMFIDTYRLSGECKSCKIRAIHMTTDNF